MGITDYGEALKGLRKAATQGLPWAQVSLAQMYEAGEGVPGSNAVAGRWYKKAADHFRDVAVVWEAEVNSAYMYRDDRLPRDDVQAYMWLAIVGSSVDPLEDEDIRRVARHMTKTQIAQAQHLAQD